MQIEMKIIDIYNLPRQSTYDVELILRLKDWGKSIFPAQNNIGINWALLKKNVPGLQAFYVETGLNKFFTISLNEQKFILVNYDKVMQIYTPLGDKTLCTSFNIASELGPELSPQSID